MATRRENKLILQALRAINKQYGSAYNKLLRRIPEILEDYYSIDEGYVDVQEIINSQLKQVNEFQQLAVYTKFYDLAYKDAILATKINYKLKYNFSQVDTKAINALTSQSNWFVSKYQTLTDQSQTLKKMKELWESGESIDKATKELDKIFTKSSDRIRKYTKSTLLTNNTRVRTTADLNSFEQGGITSYTYRAVIDNITTEVCRDLDGNVYNVKKAIEYQNKISSDMNKIISDGERKGLPDWKIWNKASEYLQNNDAFASENAGKKRPWQTKVTRRTADPLKQGRKIVKNYKNLASVPGNKIPRPPLHHGCRSRLDPNFK